MRAAETVVAGEVSVRASALRSVSGGEVEIEQSAVQRVRGDEVEIEDSAVAFVTGGRVEVEDSTAIAIAGREVHATRVRTLFLFAPRLQGDVRTVFDWKGAIAVGVGIVLTRRLLKLLRVG